MLLDEIVVVVMGTAATANERTCVGLIGSVLPAGMRGRCRSRRRRLIQGKTTVQTLPNGGQFSEGTEDRAFKFVEIVVEKVGVFYKFITGVGDGQLNLA
jgi:hypothetical protein